MTARVGRCIRAFSPRSLLSAVLASCIAAPVAGGAAISTGCAAPFIPPDVDAYVRVEHGAALRKTLDRLPIGAAVAMFLHHGLTPGAWEELSKSAGTDPAELLDRLLGRDATLVVRFADTSSDRRTDWAVATRLDRREATELIGRLRPRVLGGGRYVLAEQDVTLLWREPYLLIGPAAQSPLVDEIGRRLRDGVRPALSNTPEFIAATTHLSARRMPQRRTRIEFFQRHGPAGTGSGRTGSGRTGSIQGGGIADRCAAWSAATLSIDDGVAPMVHVRHVGPASLTSISAFGPAAMILHDDDEQFAIAVAVSPEAGEATFSDGGPLRSVVVLSQNVRTHGAVADALELATLHASDSEADLAMGRSTAESGERVPLDESIERSLPRRFGRVAESFGLGAVLAGQTAALAPPFDAGSIAVDDVFWRLSATSARVAQALASHLVGGGGLHGVARWTSIGALDTHAINVHAELWSRAQGQSSARGVDAVSEGVLPKRSIRHGLETLISLAAGVDAVRWRVTCEDDRVESTVSLRLLPADAPRRQSTHLSGHDVRRRCDR